MLLVVVVVVVFVLLLRLRLLRSLRFVRSRGHDKAVNYGRTITRVRLDQIIGPVTCWDLVIRATSGV